MTCFVDHFRPLNDVVLVRLHPTQRYSDILAIPESAAQAHPVSTGVVVRAGPGRWKLKRGLSDETEKVFIPVDAVVGAHIVFFSASMHRTRGANLHRDMADDYALIRDNDILFAYDEDLRIDV